jgi:hypothetical protein
MLPAESAHVYRYLRAVWRTPEEVAEEKGLDTDADGRQPGSGQEVCIRNMQVIARGFGLSMAQLLSRLG